MLQGRDGTALGIAAPPYSTQAIPYGDTTPEARLRYRRFGKTGLMLPVFSMGGMRFIPPNADQAGMEAVLNRGLELGINHIETAKGYGPSEEMLGLWLPGIPRDSLTITTKIGPTATVDEMWTFINQSLEKMKIDHIDNFDYHGINTPEILADIVRPDGCRAAVDRAVAEGLIRNVGFSTHGPLEVILAAIDTDLFSSVNLHYYYFNQRNRPAVMAAAARDMGVFIISPADKGGQLFNPPAKLSALTAPHHPLVFNARWLLGLHPEVHTLSFGPTFVHEFDPHIPAFDDDSPLRDDERQMVARVDAALAEIPADEFCAGCHQCLPCPVSINIPETLRLRNMAVGLDMVPFGQYRYKMFGNSGHWFPGETADKCTTCGDCLPRCPQKLDIPKLLFDTHARLATGEVGKRISSD